MAKQIFVNLPVKDLKKAIEFFAKLRFSETKMPEMKNEGGK